MDSQPNPWAHLPKSPPFILPADATFLPPDLVSRAGLKLDQIPVPFIGDPRRAPVILLGLNPGWTPLTPDAEKGEYAEQNRLCLSYASRVPFFSLDEALGQTPGNLWWRRRLRLLIESCGIDVVSHRMACVEWFPYHSRSFRRLSSLIPSQTYGFELVRAAAKRGALIIIMRSRDLWLSAAPELGTTDVLSLRVPRSPYMTPANLGASGFSRVVSALNGAT